MKKSIAYRCGILMVVGLLFVGSAGQSMLRFVRVKLRPKPGKLCRS